MILGTRGDVVDVAVAALSGSGVVEMEDFAGGTGGFGIELCIIN